MKSCVSHLVGTVILWSEGGCKRWLAWRDVTQPLLFSEVNVPVVLTPGIMLPCSKKPRFYTSPACYSRTTALTTTIKPAPIQADCKTLHACSSSSYSFSGEAASLHHQLTCLTCSGCGCLAVSFALPICLILMSAPHMPCHYRQSLHSATCPWRKSLQGQSRLYLGE